MTRPVSSDPLQITVTAISMAVLAAITLPLVVTAITAFNATTETAFPPNGWSLRWFENIFNRPELVAAFWVSLKLAVISSIITIVLSTTTALILTRYQFPGREALDGVLMSPLIVPQVITGLSFLIFFVRVESNQQFFNLLLVHVLLTLPYALRVVRSSLLRIDPKLEEAAMGLGAGPVESFIRVTLPQIRSGIFVAIFFSFVISFDNFTATAFLTSRGATLPVEMFFYIEASLDPTISAISALMIVSTTVFVLTVDRLVGINRIT